MKSTSPSPSWLRMAARSPPRSRAGPGGDVQADVHLGGDDAGEGGLAQAGRSGEEQVVGGLAAAAGRLEDDREVLLELGLADEVVEPAGPEPDLGGRLRPRRPGSARAARRAWRTASAPGRGELAQRLLEQDTAVVAVGQLADGLGDLLGAVAEARRARRARRRGRPVARRAPLPLADGRRPARRRGRSSRDLSSTSRRAAVFLPTPGTRHRAATSSSASTRRSASGWCTERMASASAGPTPWAPISASKQVRSSRVAKP